MPVDLLICAGCGARMSRPGVVPGEPVLVCPECGYERPFVRLPLFALTGPSGTGKSTVGRLLTGELAGLAVVLEQDVLWAGGLQDPADDYAAFRRTWLRLAAMVHQSGRPVVLCGTVVPQQVEHHPERVFFSAVHYLALVCEPEVLAARLRARPAWRGWDEPRIADTLRFNDWVRSATDPPLEQLDTTAAPVTDTTRAVADWVRLTLGK